MKGQSHKFAAFDSFWAVSWHFKLLLLLLLFLPVITERPYNHEDIVAVIGEVLSNPLVNGVVSIRVIAKIILAVACTVCLIYKDGRIILLYYAAAGCAVAIFQNMAQTQYGFTILPGNMAVQLVVAVYCLFFALKDGITRANAVNRNAVWVVPLMIFAFLMPYQIRDGIIVPSLRGVFTNESAVTYCMIAPVVLGMLLLVSNHALPVIHAISFVAFLFALLNMMTHFVFASHNWWMGVLHLPLLFISAYGMVISRNRQGDRRRGN
ncbi:MAG: hypothetical protein IJR50_02265 [Treponema sp.]|nr:hypothetical protein [Treponema sp.]